MKGDVSKLPKWAQEDISRLERSLAYERERLGSGPEGSNTFADPYSDPPRPLGMGTTIEFRVGKFKYRVRIEGEGIYVMGDGLISIHPRSANTFEVKAVPR